MCGVVAVWQQGPVPPDELQAQCALGMAALRHRGPDGQGLWVGAEVALGHTRLAIVDVAGGAQPLRSADGQVVLVINGELYDPARRDGGTDSALALRLYLERGPSFVSALRGEFALILWDARQRRLLAARDRFGVKPLCYAQGAGLLRLASEGKALLAMGQAAAWDEEAMHQALSLQYLLPEQTLFAGVRQVPPGHLLLAEQGRVHLQRYWDLTYPLMEAPADPRSDETLGDALLAALDQAVRLRLQADEGVGVATLLSGGLDSSVVAGLLARARGRVTCFSVSFPGGAAYDEEAVAARTAALLGADLRVVAAPPARLWEALPAAVAAGEGLAINLHIAAKHVLSRAVREAGFKVLLTGEGADEILGGYAHLRRDYLLACGGSDPQALADRAGTLVTAGVHLPEGTSLPLDLIAARLGAVPSFLQAKGTLGQRLLPLLDPDFAARWRGRDAAAALLAAVAVDVDGQLRGRHPVDQAAYLWTKLALAGYILRTLGDAMEMAHGVEGRVPFLDDAVVAAAQAAPVAARLRGGIEKQLLRAAALRAGVVTAEVAARPKHPFMAPPADPSDVMQDWLRGAGLARVPFFAARRVRALLDELPRLSARERVATDPVLMLVLSATLLQAQYGLAEAG